VKVITGRDFDAGRELDINQKAYKRFKPTELLDDDDEYDDGQDSDSHTFDAAILLDQ
jgi:hypothetical protein